MLITNRWLKGKRACQEGVEWFTSKYPEGNDGVETVKTLIDDDKLNWANWTVVRLMTHPQQIQYTIYAAEQVIDIYEKKYPCDDRPRKAIEAAKNYLKNPSEENRAAAVAANADADAAAYVAADATYVAACAAYVAACAAYVAACAADAATCAAYAAADAANAAVNAKKMKIKIIEYGIELLTKTGGM